MDRCGRLRPRLVASFVGVALISVATLALLVASVLPGRLTQLVVTRQDEAARRAAAALGEGYRHGRRWDDRALGQAGSIVVTEGAGSLSILADRAHGSGIGVGIAAVIDDTTYTVEAPIVADGSLVGSLTVEYPTDGLPGPESDLQTSLRMSILVASAVAILVALIVGLLVARRLTEPLERLGDAARSLGKGDLSTRVRGVEGPGEVGGLAAAFDQMADSLAREDDVRRHLVSDVTHELRTPVTILQASLEQLVDGTVEPSTDQLSSLHDEVLRLTRILQDLESLASAQAAGLNMVTQRVDLADVAGGAIERMRGSFAAAQIEPHAVLEPAVVLGDPSRLDQVITNLLTNALKFSPPGGHVDVVVSRMDGEARVEVEDSGPGIAPDEIDRVFERFWRGSAGRSAGGSGVGLAVVAELVHAHRGRVDVASVPGEGARFLVTLPAA